MTDLATLFGQHVDQPDDRHRLVLLDARSLRCLDCTRTLDLRPATSSLKPTSTSKSEPPRPDETCPLHLGHRDACAGCAADAKATEDGRPLPIRPVADVAAGLAAARAALAGRSNR